MALTDKLLGWLRRDSGTSGDLADKESGLIEREYEDERIDQHVAERAGSTDWTADQKAPPR
jgi:hypothetical protein